MGLPASSERRCTMNKYIENVVKVALIGGALATALPGCCLWITDKKDGERNVGKSKAAVMCNDRACSNATGGGR